MNQPVISWDAVQQSGSFLTRGVLPDNSRRVTLPHPHFRKAPRQMAVLAISSCFHFFRVFLKKIGGGARAPPATYAFVVALTDWTVSVRYAGLRP